MKPYDNFDVRVQCFYWRIMPCDDDPKTTWACWHLFRPYNMDIFKVGMGSKYLFRHYWRGQLKCLRL